jgi:hypothetical protein
MFIARPTLGTFRRRPVPFADDTARTGSAGAGRGHRVFTTCSAVASAALGKAAYSERRACAVA